MPHARPSAPTPRADTVSTVVVLTTAADVAALAARGGPRWPDPTAYRRRLRRHLDRLARRGGHVRVARLDPEEYAAFCARRGADPRSPAARARYAGAAAGAGPTLRYRGQPLGRLLDTLHAADERERTAERAAAILADAGECARCGRPRAVCAVREADAVAAEVVRRAGPGRHRLVCTLSAPEGPLAAVAQGSPVTGDRPPGDVPDGGELTEPGGAADAWLLLRMVLAAALTTGGSGGLVLRSVPDGDDAAPREIRGWELAGGRVRPLSEAEVFAACCTEPGSGAPLPPEPGVVHRAATELPDLRCG